MDERNSTNRTRSHCPLHHHSQCQQQEQQRRRPHSIFHVSNPSASDDHDQDPQAEFDLGCPSPPAPPPSSQCHCYQDPTTRTRESLPPLVVDEKRWRRRFLRSGGRRPRGEFTETLRDTRKKRRSVSPPQYTADGFVYPEGGGEEGEEEVDFRDEDMQEQDVSAAYRMPDRALLNPYAYSSYTDTGSRTTNKYTPQPRTHAPPPGEHYMSNEVPPPAHRSPAVLFADVRPLSITRRRFSRQTRIQVTNHRHQQSQSQSRLPPTTQMHPRRHSEGQGFGFSYPYPTTPSTQSGHGMGMGMGSSQGHGDPFSHYQQPWTGCMPEFMGKSSSHDRTGGRSYTSSSTLNNRRMSASADVVRRPEHSREISSFSGTATRRRPPIRLAVQGLSYVDEDPEIDFHYPTPGLGLGSAAKQRPPELRPCHPSPSAQAQARFRFRSQFKGELGGVGVRRGSECQRDAKTGNERTRTRTVSRQPQPHPGMQTKPGGGGGGGNRNFKRMPYADNGKRDWSTDLCLFCDHNLGTCCKALWCPCIIYGRNKARIEHLYAEEKIHPTKGGTFSNDCVIHACLTTFCLFGWAIQVPNRASIRRRYNIEGDWLGDCAAALFCSPCELSQESREIDLEERSLERSSVWDKGEQNVI